MIFTEWFYRYPKAQKKRTIPKDSPLVFILFAKREAKLNQKSIYKFAVNNYSTNRIESILLI